MVPLPTVLGLIVCEKVIIEQGTRNVSLVTCFNGLVVERVPTPPCTFAVYSTLTDGQGRGTIALVISSLETHAEKLRLRRLARAVETLERDEHRPPSYGRP